MLSHAFGFDLTHETVSRWDFYPGTTVPMWPDMTLTIAVGKKWNAISSGLILIPKSVLTSYGATEIESNRV